MERAEIHTASEEKKTLTNVVLAASARPTAAACFPYLALRISSISTFLMLKIACTMLALGAGGMLPERAAAQTWPSRPIMLVVPYAPGGNVDIAARVFAKELSSKLGQQFVIENKSGAGGIVGSVAVAKAAPTSVTLRNRGGRPP